MVAEAVYLSGLNAFQSTMDVFQHNLGNARTPGFQALMPLHTEAPLNGGANAHSKLSYVDHKKAYKSLQIGHLKPTHYNLDFSLIGPGYFEVRNAAGETHYKRVLQAHVDADTGSLMTEAQETIVGEEGDLLIPQGTSVLDISATSEGELRVKDQSLGRFHIVRFEDETKVKPIGHNTLTTDQEALPVFDEEGHRLTTLKQGVVEESTVNTTDTLMKLMELQKQFQALNDAAKSEHKRQLDFIRKFTSLTA